MVTMSLAKKKKVDRACSYLAIQGNIVKIKIRNNARGPTTRNTIMVALKNDSYEYYKQYRGMLLI